MIAHISAVLAFLGVAALGPAADAATVRANPSNVNAVLASAKPGDTVVLTAGEYPSVGIKKKTYNPALVIDASDATLIGWRVASVQGLTFKGGTFQVPPAVHNPRKDIMVYAPAIRFDSVGQIRFSNAAFKGPGDLSQNPPVLGQGIGLSVNVGADVSVTNSRFMGLKAGAGFSSVDGFKIVGNTFTGMRSDGFQAASSRNGLIEGNECSGTRISSNEHPDCIQLWSRPPAQPTADIVIRKNKITGPTQGIGMFNHVRDGVDDGGFDRILIEDNDIEVGFPNAIGLGGSRNSVVRNNRIRTFAGSRYLARIAVDAATCGNVVAAGAGKPGRSDKRC